MGFKEDVDRLATQVKKRAEHINNEETTKQALIIPFLQILGYDVFDPLEVKSEYLADFGKKKSEKVDYAIFDNGKPIIFIEAKPVNEKLVLTALNWPDTLTAPRTLSWPSLLMV